MDDCTNFERGGEGWKIKEGNWHVVQYLREACGLNVMPLITNGKRCKAPKLKWADYQLKTIPDDIITEAYAHPFTDPSGIGVICGSTSGNLELLDFDGGLLWDWADRVETEIGPNFRENQVVVATPSGGFHIYYRCPVIEGNLKLAYNREGDIEIETRGQGGQAVMPGSPNSTHPSGKPYVLAHGSFHAIPTISLEEREVYVEVAKSFCERPAKPLKDAVLRDLYPDAFDNSVKGERPGDDFNARTTWAEILVPKGWMLLHESNSICYWRRPGKLDSSPSATTGYCKTEDGQELLHVFSTNAQPFEGEETYSKFSAYAHLYHKGDFNAAAQRLADCGYGSRISLSRSEEEVNQFFERYYS